MISLKQWMECVNYRITEGSDYGWNCFGPHTYSLDSWDGNQDGASSSVVFDTVTQTVYEVTVCDYEKNRAYRLCNTAFNQAHAAESQDRGANADVAWDDVDYIDLDTVEDFMDKCKAIMNGEDYDTRVSVPLDLPRDELFKFMTMAHERDITFNQLIEEALWAALKEAERDPEGYKRRTKEFLGE